MICQPGNSQPNPMEHKYLVLTRPTSLSDKMYEQAQFQSYFDLYSPLRRNNRLDCSEIRMNETNEKMLHSTFEPSWWLNKSVKTVDNSSCYSVQTRKWSKLKRKTFMCLHTCIHV